MLKDKIKVLIELQNCDTLIQGLEKRKNEAPLRVKALSDEKDSISKGFQEDEDRLDAVKAERRSLEDEVEDLDARIRKGNEKLSSIKSNKEYTAALKEIETFNKKKAALEDQLLVRIEELEAVSERCKQNQEHLQSLEAELEKSRKAAQKELVEIEKEMAELKEKRTGIARKADSGLLGHYQLIRQRLGIYAVSPVVEGVCMTCHMTIPPQMFNELMRCSELASCPHCNRIIYWGEDAHFQDLTNP
jgi:uncharacterized protein